MKWRFQFILLVLIMACMIMGGIHLAERGIQRVDGIQDGPAESFHVARLENGKLEMTVLGKEYFIKDETVLPVFGSLSSPPLANDEYRESFAWEKQIDQ